MSEADAIKKITGGKKLHSFFFCTYFYCIDTAVTVKFNQHLFVIRISKAFKTDLLKFISVSVVVRISEVFVYVCFEIYNLIAKLYENLRNLLSYLKRIRDTVIRIWFWSWNTDVVTGSLQ